jgi:hypothetical protein
MNRRAFLAASLAAAGLCGCRAGKQRLRTLTRAELEPDMAERLGLRDVELTDQGEGRFTGTAKNAQGDVVELEVVQQERRRSWKTRWKADGRGGDGEGSVSW